VRDPPMSLVLVCRSTTAAPQRGNLNLNKRAIRKIMLV
jgi:hypothetical protein